MYSGSGIGSGGYSRTGKTTSSGYGAN